jgi:mono/diheme cytochrome c family protein
VSKLINPLLSLTAILLAVVVWVQVNYSTSNSDSAADSESIVKSDFAVKPDAEVESYRPRLEHDPPVPNPPAAGVRDFETFLGRLRETAETAADSLVLHQVALDRAEQVFRETVGVPDDVPLARHSPFYTVDPEAIFSLYHDLPTLERGLGLFQQHCITCHGPYGRGNGSATQQWYAGNLPRNFSYGKFKSRSTKYGALPTDSDLFRTLTRGLYGSTMPPFRHLSVQDRWALVQFIKSLANFYDEYDEVTVNRFDQKADDLASDVLDIGKEPPVTLDSVKRGRALFLKQGCVKCHQGSKPSPVGLARWEGGFTNWNDEMNRPVQHSRDLTTHVFLSGAAPSDLFRIISGGPTIGPMPSYQNIPQADVWALVHYVQSVFKPDYPQAPLLTDAAANPQKSSDTEQDSATEDGPSPE